MQGWLFISDSWTLQRIQAYLGGVENDRMIILDLYRYKICGLGFRNTILIWYCSEARPQYLRTNNYYGKPWIYCVLHDFGGNMGIRGDLPTIMTAPIDALQSSNGTMLGIGLTMEGIYQNYVVYDLTLEMAWTSKKLDYSAWILQFVKQRYNIPEKNAAHAWQILAATAYNCTRCIGGIGKSILVYRYEYRKNFMYEITL